jgi:hypothetical protein
MAIYFFLYASNPTDNIIINNSLLAFHEAGHLFLGFFGEVIGVLGGTIFQLALPLVLIIYFLLKGHFYSTSIIGMLLGASFINVSFYVKDAEVMNLDLIGGGIHDWNYLLSKMGFLEYAVNIGNKIYWLGFVIILASLLIATYYSLKSDEEAGNRVLNILD